MNQKKLQLSARQTAERAAAREEQNRRIAYAATASVKEVLQWLHTNLRGLDEEMVLESREKNGTNRVTREKKKSLAKRLAGAFINPFTIVLFCLALVSCGNGHDFPVFFPVRQLAG